MTLSRGMSALFRLGEPQEDNLHRYTYLWYNVTIYTNTPMYMYTIRFGLSLVFGSLLFVANIGEANAYVNPCAALGVGCPSSSSSSSSAPASSSSSSSS